MVEGQDAIGKGREGERIMSKEKMEILQTQMMETGEALFVYTHNGGEVFIAGDFNEWNPRSHRMNKREGFFQRKLKLTPGTHEYKFIVDGEWQTDPSAAEQCPNEFGSMNSVIHV
jgi:1,4-alpha-glucan branching enzyme